MIFVFYGHDRSKYPSVFDKLFELRHQVFVVNRLWSLPCQGTREIDQYDTNDAVYFVDFDESGQVLAHVRYTPTMRSSLTADYFPHLVENGVDPRGPTIYEATRFMVLPTQRDKSNYRRVKAGLIAAATDWCIENGITHMQTVIDAGTLSAYVEISIKVKPLGLAHPFGGGKGVPGGGECLVFRLAADEALLEDIRSFGQISGGEKLWERPLRHVA